jgi:hypothetical protein
MLSPRQQLTPTPYAMTASNLTGTLAASQLSGTLPNANFGGTYTGALTFNNAANSISGIGTGLRALNASQLTSGIVPDARLSANIARTSQVWLLDGNAGTTPGAHFLGTTDNQPLEFKVNGLRALRLEDNGDGSDPGTTADGAPNVIGGSMVNFVGAGVVGATIAGGGATNYAGLAYTNSVLADFGVVGGGRRNTIAPGSLAAAIAGGYLNDIGTNSDYSAIGGGNDNNIAANSLAATIAGGFGNDIGTNSGSSAIGGGQGNNIAANSQFATIAGGFHNEIRTNSNFSTIGGGNGNDIAANAEYATIPGGSFNAATNYAFATGRRAKANHTGSFVWADSSNFDFASSASNQFNVRAVGGVRIVTGIDGSGAPNAGVSLNASATSWNVISDRAAKKNFRSADGREILERLAQLPIQHWNYKWEADDAVPHLGPVAQDFKAAFYPGRDDKHISTLEFDGVALAAIQGLNQKMEEQLNAKNAHIEALQKRIERLEKLLSTLTAQTVRE